jgi:hypothetical protein
MSGGAFKKGQRFKVETAFNAYVLTSWKATFTGGGIKTTPVGLEFVIDNDPPPKATAAIALPDPYDEWERKLVSQTDWGSEKYGGYYLSISFNLINANCMRC